MLHSNGYFTYTSKTGVDLHCDSLLQNKIQKETEQVNLPHINTHTQKKKKAFHLTLCLEGSNISMPSITSHVVSYKEANGIRE